MEDIRERTRALRQSDPEQIVQLLRSAADAAGRSAADRLDLHLLRGEILRDLGRLDQAEAALGELTPLLAEIDDPETTVSALVLEGSIAVERGQQAAAIELFHEARARLEQGAKGPVRRSLARVYNALGVAYSQLEDHAAALEYFRRASEHAEAAGDLLFAINTRGNAATATAGMGNLSAAIAEHRAALAMAKAEGQWIGAGYQLANICDHQFDLGELDAAEQSCREALGYLEENQHVRVLSGTVMLLGDIARERGDLTAATAHYTRAYDITLDRVPLIQVEVLQKLAEVATERGELQVAVAYYQHLLAEREQMRERQRADIAAELEARFRADQARAQIELLQLRTQLQDAELNSRNNLIAALVAALLLAIALGLIAWQNYRSRARLQQQLLERNAELEQALVQIRDLATIDPLTGLLNRRGFADRADYALARHRRDGTPLTVAVTDIDHFKQLNDTYGHATGDEVLREVAARIQAGVRDVDILCRWGGEEFVLLCPAADVTTAQGIVERIMASLRSEDVRITAGAFPIRMTFGIAPVSDGLDRAITQADEAMYRGKRAGRDCIAISEA